MKVCGKCKIEKDDSDFSRKTDRKLQSYCKVCQKVTQKTYLSGSDAYRRHRDKVAARNVRMRQEYRELTNRLKSAPCTDCKRQFNPWQMDFDHLDGETKLKNISQMDSHSQKTLLDEIAKCEVVCANCHRQRTHDRYYLELGQS